MRRGIAGAVGAVVIWWAATAGAGLVAPSLPRALPLAAGAIALLGLAFGVDRAWARRRAVRWGGLPRGVAWALRWRWPRR